MSAQPIGVFDSGVGGLLVASTIRRRLPAEDILFLGDTARQPYGGHGQRVIADYARQCCGRLIEAGAKMIVVACHTASAAAEQALKDTFGHNVPILGMAAPSTEALLASSPTRVGILATRHTVASGAYQRAIQLRSKARILAQACPLWVPLVEEGATYGRVAQLVVSQDLAKMRRFRPQAVLLGCTHFPLLRHLVHARLGTDVSIITGMDAVARQVDRLLVRRKLVNDSGEGGKLRLLFTDDGSPAGLRAFTGDLPQPDSIKWGVRLGSLVT